MESIYICIEHTSSTLCNDEHSCEECPSAIRLKYIPMLLLLVVSYKLVDIATHPYTVTYIIDLYSSNPIGLYYSCVQQTSCWWLVYRRSHFSCCTRPHGNSGSSHRPCNTQPL